MTSKNACYVVVAQSLSHVQLFVIPWTAARHASLSFTISLSLLKLLCIEVVMPSNHLILCHPLLLPPSIFPNLSQHQGFFSESALCIRWPKYWSFNISPSSEYWGMISFRIGQTALLSKGLSRELSSTTVWMHKFFSAQPSLWSNSHICTWLLEKT